ncbi:hypothetical protein ACFQUU_05035 [Herbaspirillum sp. GCM10030257]|uniref:hypothetical protein n=1 Tax=Herbaspirillum sp. GCM10030257 TaxID=3273393 RepID=UPI003614D96B
MPLDFAEFQYDVTQWEPLLDTAEAIKFNDSAWDEKNCTSAFQRKTGDRPRRKSEEAAYPELAVLAQRIPNRRRMECADRRMEPL